MSDLPGNRAHCLKAELLHTALPGERGLRREAKAEDKGT